MKRDFKEWLSTFRACIADYCYYADFDKINKNVDDIKVELNILNTLDEKKKMYIQQLIGFIEIFENYNNIENIEMKMQGAILFIMLKLCDDKKLISIFDESIKNNENVRNIIKILISSLNSRDNYINN